MILPTLALMAERWRRVVFAVGVSATVLGAGCVPSVRPYTVPVHEQVLAQEGLVYGSAPGVSGNPVDLELDLFEPAGSVDADRPAVVFVHGGGFTTGSRHEIRYLAEDFARRGYVTATIDYRLRAGSYFSFAAPSDEARSAITDARHDAQAAVRWMRANAAAHRVDPDRIAVVGYSAGGMTALGVAFRSDDPGSSGTPGVSSRVCTAVSLSGMAAEDGIDASDPPVTLIHGSADDLVPTHLARYTALAAASVGRLARYHEYPGVGHLLIIDPRAATYRDVTAESLADALTADACS